MGQTRNLTILLTDIKGFTDKTSRKTRADILAMLEKHKELVLPILEAKGGKLVKTIGDAFLVVFDSPTDAVLAGVAVQDTLREYNADKEGDDRIDVRIAINSGEVTLADNDIFGDPVNITARIESVAEAGEVFFTEAVYLAMNKKEVPSSEIGLLQLKGIPEKIRAYKVVRESPVEDLPQSGAETASSAGGFLRMLGRKKTVPPAPGKAKGGAPRAPLLRRAPAALADFLVCMLLIGAFVSDKDTTYRVSKGTAPPKFGAEMNDAGRRIISEEIRKNREVLDSLPDHEYTYLGEKTPLNGIFKRFAKVAKTEIVLRPDVRGEFKPDFRAVPFRKAFGAVLEKKELTAEFGEDGLIHIRKAAGAGDGPAAWRKTVKIPGLLETRVETKHGDWKDVKGKDGKVRRVREYTKTETVQLGPAGEAAEAGPSETLYSQDGLRVEKVTKKRDRVFPLVWIIYSTFFLSLWSATPGKKVLGLRVVRMDDGGGLDWKLGLVRSLFMLISAAPMMLGFVWALFEKDGRAWHDLIAGTRVVRNPS